MTSKSGSAGQWMARVASVVSVAALAACGGGGGTTAAQGTLQLSLTDAPACYESVVVTVQKVRVHVSDTAEETEGGWQDIVPANGPVKVDLLNLTNGALADLGSAQMPAGKYTQLRLVLAPNTAADPLANAVKPVGGQLVALTTPSGSQSGLKVKGDIDVPEGDVSSMVLDFDACKSVVRSGNSGRYVLKPVLRLTPRTAAGISGYIATTMTLGSTTVSAQQGGTVVRSTVPDATGKFVLGSLPSGTYTVVITADAHATGVIDSVPVGTTTTTAVNGTATAIVLPAATMNTVTGTVTAAGTTGTAVVPVSDATVSAFQTVNAISIQVASQKIDDDVAGYTLRLPAAAPVIAPFSAGGLTFTPDAAAAGKYTVRASAEGRATLSKPVDVGTAGATADFGF